jgi:hypothetical protein
MMTCLFFCLVALIPVVICIVVARIHEAAFEAKYPPLSDAEYVALCSPGTDPNVALTVRRIISESLNVDYERIYPSARLYDDLGAE